MYAADKQTDVDVVALQETDAYPATPEDGYGWEKLFSERMCRHFRKDHGLAIRIARYHNVNGPNGRFDGGREKAPVAICRKVAECAPSGSRDIEIWSDGEQTRSFMYVSGSMRLMASDCVDPINIGSDESTSINQLVDLAGVKLNRRYKLEALQGRSWSKQRQHDDQGNTWLGAVNLVAIGTRSNLSLGLRTLVAKI